MKKRNRWRWLHSNTSFSTPDLSMFPQRQASVGSSRMDALAGEPPHKVSRLTDHDPLPPGPPTEVSNLASAGDEITTSAELSSSVPPFKWQWKRRAALLRLYAIFKKELSASNIDEQTMWEKIAENITKQSPHRPDSKQVRNQIDEIKSEYERKKDNEPTDQFSAAILDEAENAFENNENQYVFSLQSNLEKVDMSKQDRVKLLQVYAKYKEEILLQKFDVEMQILWGKVAREVSKNCFTFYGKRRCCYEIRNLKAQYERLKKNPSNACSLPYFFDEARKAFDSAECPEASCSPAVTTSTELSSSVPPFKWKFKRRVALLRLYGIYKKELSASNIDEQTMWKKIAEIVGKKSPHRPDSKQVRNEIQAIKSEYEKKKHSKPTDQFSATILDEAENAFESNENQFVFSLQSKLEKTEMSQQDRVKILQVYAKYKAEISLQKFDAEMQILWGKIAREVSKNCSSFFGKRRCCYEITNLKSQYERLKRNPSNAGSLPYFFDEARKAFD